MADQSLSARESTGHKWLPLWLRSPKKSARRGTPRHRGGTGVNDPKLAVAKGKRQVTIQSFAELAELEPERLRWLWPGRIPYGKLTLLAGDPGLGKSWVTLDLAARISAGGTLPDGGNVETADVLLLSAEDGAVDTILPRLAAQGADLQSIHRINLAVGRGREEYMLDLSRDFAEIRRNVEGTGASLVVIDPVLAFTGQLDTHRGTAVRRVLSPLAIIAEQTEAAIVGVMHLTKGSHKANSLYRVAGSISFVAAARSVLLVATHPENPDLRILAQLKSNLAEIGPPLEFHIDGSGNDPSLVWDGIADFTARERLMLPDREHRLQLGKATKFLRACVKMGETRICML